MSLNHFSSSQEQNGSRKVKKSHLINLALFAFSMVHPFLEIFLLFGITSCPALLSVALSVRNDEGVYEPGDSVFSILPVSDQLKGGANIVLEIGDRVR